MIPTTIYELACALAERFGLDFDEGVSAAWEIARTLEQNSVHLVNADQQVSA